MLAKISLQRKKETKQRCSCSWLVSILQLKAAYGKLRRKIIHEARYRWSLLNLTIFACTHSPWKADWSDPITCPGHSQSSGEILKKQHVSIWRIIHGGINKQCEKWASCHGWSRIMSRDLTGFSMVKSLTWTWCSRRCLKNWKYVLSAVLLEAFVYLCCKSRWNTCWWGSVLKHIRFWFLLCMNEAVGSDHAPLCNHLHYLSFIRMVSGQKGSQQSGSTKRLTRFTYDHYRCYKTWKNE